MAKKKSSTKRHKPAPKAKPSAKRQEPARQDEPPLTPEKFRKLAEPHLQIIKTTAGTKLEKAERLRAHHGLGRILQARMPPCSYGDKQIEQMAEAIAYRSRWLYLVWQFARKYTVEDLENLCEYADRLSWAHVSCLLSLDKEKRSTYQQRAAKHKWNSEDLRLAIRREAPGSGERTNRKGPETPVPDDPVLALARLADEGDLWCRRCGLVVDSVSGRRFRGLRERSTDATSAVRAFLEAARDAMKKLLQDDGR
jgi:hypothetical protein